MRAAYYLHGTIHVGEVSDPIPAKGQVLVKTLTCGICASDAHWLKHAEKIVAISKETGGFFSLDLNRPIVFGHEYVGEIVDYGPGSKRPLKIGTRVTSLPAVFEPHRLSVVGHSNDFPGGYGEYMLLDENLLMEIPQGLDADLAAMTEPLAVGLHHARIGRTTADDVPLVVGCGAIGLGIIAGLKLQGAAPIIGADLAPSRRQLALQMGADVVVDPRQLAPYGPVPELGMRRASVVYECVGLPGMLDLIMRSVGHGARIIMGGWCLEVDQFQAACAHMKQLSVQFTGGEEQQDLDLALRAIGDGSIDIRPWLGDQIGLSGVGDSLVAMADPAHPIRTVVHPGRAEN